MLIMSSTAMANLDLDYGFRPMRHASWYKRAQAWILSRGNRRYDAMVADEKRALRAPGRRRRRPARDGRGAARRRRLRRRRDLVFGVVFGPGSGRPPRGAPRPRPGGRFVFLEHVAAPHHTALRFAQRAIAPLWRAFSDGCHPDRDTAALIGAAGFANLELRRFALPVPIMSPHIAGAAIASDY
jgi:hypothetical protein